MTGLVWMRADQEEHARLAWLRTQMRLGKMSERRAKAQRAEFVSSYAKAFGHSEENVRQIIKDEIPPRIFDKQNTA